MTWYAAHLIIYIELLDEKQDEYPVQESIILIEADSIEAAYSQADTIGKSDFEDEPSTNSTTWNDLPARWVFGGIRKMIECHDIPSKETKWKDPQFKPTHGTEITNSNLTVQGKENLFKLIKGEAVDLSYDDVE